MQLSKIKISGFKSFVDPTTVLLPSNLVAVVGPNGCGKSNIIDAITWVMGESSAKQLRGELLTDVIFNGSGNRKPIGQASVELIFDNQDGSLGGEYSQYAEISIKRVITRNADSSYFLNGSRCRRKDVIDIFLGTGLGPRSYSIIGQNMISRLIEAKPEDMRVYLEEAAGISKYKERRRETENRIHHTKENLLRLDDVRAELEKQLSTLKRQASAAERFKALKEEERVIRAQWYAVQWRQLDTRLSHYTLQIQQQETALAGRQTDLGSLDKSLETTRDNQQAAAETFHEVQRRYYVTGNDISRMEQEIRHHQERQLQWQTDLSLVDNEWSEVVEQLEEIQDQLGELEGDLVQLEPDTHAAANAVAEATSALREIEEASQVWQASWDEFNQSNAKTTQVAQVEQTRIQHLEQKLATLDQRQEKLAQEQEGFKFDDIELTLDTLSQQVEEAEALAETHDDNLETIREELRILQTKQQDVTTKLNQVRSELQQCLGQEASLTALQQTALGQRNNKLVDWLTENGLDKNTRLAQNVKVDAGWEAAVEKVLGSYLQAICVDNIADVAATINQFKDGNLCVFATHANQPNTDATQANSLLSKVKSDLALHPLLGGIYVADTLEDALKLCETLAPHESVITPEGVWLSPSWLQLAQEKDPAAGVFQREQDLKCLELKIVELTDLQTSLDQQLQETREQLQHQEQQREQLQKVLNQAHAHVAEIQAREKIQRERLNDLKLRSQKVIQEKQDCLTQLEQAQSELSLAKAHWQDAMSHLEEQAERRESLIAERDQSRATLQQKREAVTLSKDQASQLQIRLQTSLSEQSTLKQSAVRMQSQLSTLAKRKSALEGDLDKCVPVVDLKESLSEALAKRLTMEVELTAARQAMESLEQQLRDFESKRQVLEREMGSIRDVLEGYRLEGQSLKVKTEGILEQAEAIGAVIEEVLQTLPSDATAEGWQSQLEQITTRITRLGPINLVAIDEYTTCAERKEYLDTQQADLQDGLTTLEDAIAKIDKETRAKFKDTFDKVNNRFQELFPAIFGGGRAYLELTGENLLDAGITVMACPPGKRNSTIHLLSGGEKALTAISLVFSIFHLNPAPFCLLDEVDAPLDDANIGRFCKLVKSMSEKTQFIFISHNKLAIEMGKHLIGVTMHEPGVSRLVSVNLEEAIHLAGA
jgi:chromosome segregation protein